MSFVSEDMADKALHYLLDTSEDFAKATSDTKFYYNCLKETTVDLLRETEATEFVSAEGSQDLRKSIARSSDDYKEIVKKRQEILEQYRESEYKRQRLESGREAARMTLSIYQSYLRHSNEGM